MLQSTTARCNPSSAVSSKSLRFLPLIPISGVLNVDHKSLADWRMSQSQFSTSKGRNALAKLWRITHQFILRSIYLCSVCFSLLRRILRLRDFHLPIPRHSGDRAVTVLTVRVEWLSVGQLWQASPLRLQILPLG